MNMNPGKSTISSDRGQTREIPQKEWLPFLAQFTRENRGAHARLEIIGQEIGYQVETEDRPFDGVSADVKDGEHTVWIIFGATPEEHHSHGVAKATVLRVMFPDAPGSGPVLEVESQDGTKTLLELSDPEKYALPPVS
ncbi:MAG: hypothetical protein JWO19_446 [Bryobacterales bacterium]|nr:hypothetical protein [Bryobacterales bacterium]